MGLVHDIVDGICHVIECSRRQQKIFDEHDHPFVEMRDGDIGNQGKEKQYQGEKSHKEVESDPCGAVDGAAFGKRFEKVAKHIQQWYSGAWERHNPQEIIIFIIPRLRLVVA